MSASVRRSQDEPSFPEQSLQAYTFPLGRDSQALASLPDLYSLAWTVPPGRYSQIPAFPMARQFQAQMFAWQWRKEPRFPPALLLCRR